MAHLIHSIPHSAPFTRSIEPTPRGDDAFFTYQTHWSHPPLKEDTTAAWNFLDPLFLDDRTVAEIEGRVFTAPARLECFWDDHTRTRGVTVFDQQGRLIIHVVSALLGYEGSGPRLSWQLMERLAVPRELFDALQSETKHTRPYMVVVSREGSTQPDGQRLILGLTPLLDEWAWARVD